MTASDRNQELEAEVLRLKKIVEQADKLNSAPKPDLLALRDRVLKSLLSGTGQSRHNFPPVQNCC